MELTISIYDNLKKNELVYIKCNHDNSMEIITNFAEQPTNGLLNNNNSQYIDAKQMEIPSNNITVTKPVLESEIIDKNTFNKIRTMTSIFHKTFHCESVTVARSGSSIFNILSRALKEKLKLPINCHIEKQLMEPGLLVVIMKCYTSIDLAHMPKFDLNLLKSLPEPTTTIIKNQKLRLLLYLEDISYT